LKEGRIRMILSTEFEPQADSNLRFPLHCSIQKCPFAILAS
jgi:hypothetical protein